MSVTLDNIQSRMAAVADLNEDTSDISTAEYSLRREFVNFAQREWAETYDWQSLYRESHSVISTSTGNASVALPTDFRKLASAPLITFDGSNTEYFPEIRPQEREQYDSQTSRYIEILGDENSGRTMFIHSSALVSGASVMIPYYRAPASLSTSSDVVMCPNPDYLTQRALAWLWEGKRDNRYPQAKAEADKILARMLEFEQVKSEAYNDRIQTVERTQYGNFRWGKN